MDKQKIALTLSTGGARGIAHIGAIEELIRQGFEITSIAGSSMGALVGAAYATGNLQGCKDVLCGLTKRSFLSLADYSFSKQGFLKGEKIMRTLCSVIPEANIENLPIPFTAIATDVNHNREIVMDKGSLHQAIRASISLPTIFKPVRRDEMLLIDGGIINPLPLDRVKRTPGDILVAVAVSAPRGSDELPENFSYNGATLLTESTTIMVQKLIAFSIEKNKPALFIRVPALKYGIHEFYRATEIIQEGTMLAREAIARYRASNGL